MVFRFDGDVLDGVDKLFIDVTVENITIEGVVTIAGKNVNNTWEMDLNEFRSYQADGQVIDVADLANEKAEIFKSMEALYDETEVAPQSESEGELKYKLRQFYSRVIDEQKQG